MHCMVCEKEYTALGTFLFPLFREISNSEFFEFCFEETFKN
jgi:hypothetical protein